MGKTLTCLALAYLHMVGPNLIPSTLYGCLSFPGMFPKWSDGTKPWALQFEPNANTILLVCAMLIWLRACTSPMSHISDPQIAYSFKKVINIIKENFDIVDHYTLVSRYVKEKLLEIERKIKDNWREKYKKKTTVTSIFVKIISSSIRSLLRWQKVFSKLFFC